LKAITKLVLLVFLLTLNACVDTNFEKITIGFSQCVSNDLWRQEMNKSMQIQADLFDNVHLEIVDANSNAALQSKQIQQFIDKKVDAIIVSPWQSSPLTAVIQKAINNHGAVLYCKGTFYNNCGFKVDVVDTVGSGDSFLASLVTKLFNEVDPQEAVNFACAVGAIVAQNEGANPEISQLEIDEFLSGF
jgi:ABC-type sugar transport system substrate-binding protein